MRSTALSIVLLMALGCGSDKDGKTSEAGVESSPVKSFKVTNESALPECSAAAEGSLAYASEEAQFFACENSKWAVVEIKGKDGISIDSIWRYHLDNIKGAPELASEAEGGLQVAIGTIQLTKFSDGSALVSTSGNSFDPDLGAADFSHVFMLPASKDEQEYFTKFTSYASTRMRYKITLDDKPAFKAVVDTDGNFANNSDITLSLEKT